VRAELQLVVVEMLVGVGVRVVTWLMRHCKGWWEEEDTHTKTKAWAQEGDPQRVRHGRGAHRPQIHSMRIHPRTLPGLFRK